jgi:protocatechuate 3,4-dioxygenase beta subunit
MHDSLPTAKPPPPPEEVPASRPDGIDGFILDEAGRPVGDATVQIIDLRYVPTSTRPLDRRWEEQVFASTVSGEDGRYAFDSLVPKELKVLKASKPGFVTQMKDQVRVPARRDFRLVPGAAVRGRVVSETTGAPIASVGVKGWFPAGSEPVDRKGFRWTEEVFTNRNGEFSFEGAPAGLVRFMLAHPDYEDMTEEMHEVPRSGRAGLVFKMKEALVVEGVVLNELKGTPVPDVEVGASAGIVGFPIAQWTGRTGRDGRFRLAGVRSGSIVFSLTGRGVTPLAEKRDLAAKHDFSAGRKGEPLEFKVKPAGRIAGRVVGVDGNGIPRARIFVSPTGTSLLDSVRDPARHGGSRQDGEIRTDANGAFLVDDIGPAHYKLVGEAPGFALGVSEAVSAGPDEIRENVVITLRPSPVILGTLTDEHHRPIARAPVIAKIPPFTEVWFPPGFDVGQESKIEAQSDERGSYRIELPYEATVVLAVDHPDYVLVEGVEVAVKDVPDVVKDFTLKPALAIAGTVIGADGRAAPGALVRAWPDAGGALRETKANATGGYSLSRLEGGTYRVHAKRPEANETSDFQDGVTAGVLALDFRLMKAAELVGAVTDTAGRPVREFQVLLRPTVPPRESPAGRRKTAIAGLSERQEDVDDDSGRFKVAGMDPGAWTLQIAAKGYARSLPLAQVLAPGSTTSAGTIVVRPGGTVSGRVLAPGGAPAGGVGISVTRVGKLPEQEDSRIAPEPPVLARTDAGGDYALRGISPGEYLLKVESQAFVDPPGERLPIREGDVVERSYALKAAATITVSVRDEVNAPVQSVVVTVRDKGQRKLRYDSDAASGDHTDAAGRLTLRRLPAGEEVTIHLMRPGFEIVESVQRLREGDNGTVEVKLPRILFR